MKHKNVLVTGASIAGPTLAYWLNRYGFDVTLVERSPQLRLGGQNIDVKGPAREIARRMGIEESIAARNTTEIGLRFVDVQNRIVAEFPKDDSLSMTQDLEILRGDLVQILYDLTKSDVEYRFGDWVTNVQDSGEGVAVTFSSGISGTFDLVVAAEGIGSNTRDMVFQTKPKFKYLGLHTAFFTIQKQATDSRWARWCNAQNGIVFMLRPDNYGTTRASVTFTGDENEFRDLNIGEQKKALINRIKNSEWEVERLIEGINKSEDLYFDRVSQVKAPKWNEGRVALVGDAAWCATPIAGRGVDLSMAGAYILAGELSLANSHQEAFNNYEEKMRPYVKQCQKLPPGIPNLVYPQSKTGVSMLNFVVSIAGSKFTKSVMNLFGKKNKNDREQMVLPRYT